MQTFTRKILSGKFWVFTFLFIMSSYYFQCETKSSVENLMDDTYVQSVIDEMVTKYGDQYSSRIETGVTQVKNFWMAEDGSKEVFKNFCLENFVEDEKILNQSFQRLEKMFEDISGHIVEMTREFQWNLQVDTGPVIPVDYLMANFNLGSHVDSDLYKSKIAFFVLLNFKVHTLDDCLKYGDGWSREKWAQARLAQRFTDRVPADISQRIYETYVSADNYISNYNIYMHNLITEDGKRLFPEGLKLITHWGLRDELKAQYSESDGLPRQKMIYEVMKKIITQEIPEVVIDNPDVDWKVATNEIPESDVSVKTEPETRYLHLLEIFKAEMSADSYYPLYPTFIDRRFNQHREIPEDVVKQLFVEMLTSTEFRQIGELINTRLGRDLEPFDIWYRGFRGKAVYSEDELDGMVSKRYPDIKNFQAGITGILLELGFDIETASFLQTKINVDPARGAGHAMGAGRRSDNAHLRTRVPKGGMDYKGFNIAVHELGHNVEQVFSLNRIDHTLLEGVPNTAFTEAFAFVFQGRDLDILGLAEKDPLTDHFKAINQLWSVCEIAGVSLVDMGVWRWMYENPDATSEELKLATIDIAKDIWNSYFYPVLGHQDAIILAVYSHMIDAGLYLPDYPVGHIIQFQIEQYIKDKNLAREMERMCKLGSVTPDNWMKQAVGEKISVKPLLKAVREALQVIS